MAMDAITPNKDKARAEPVKRPTVQEAEEALLLLLIHLHRQRSATRARDRCTHGGRNGEAGRRREQRVHHLFARLKLLRLRRLDQP